MIYHKTSQEACLQLAESLYICTEGILARLDFNAWPSLYFAVERLIFGETGLDQENRALGVSIDVEAGIHRAHDTSLNDKGSKPNTLDLVNIQA